MRTKGSVGMITTRVLGKGVRFNIAMQLPRNIFFKETQSPLEAYKNLVDREGLEPSTN